MDDTKIGHIGREGTPLRSWQLVVFGGPCMLTSHFGAIKISKEKAIGAMCDEFNKGT